MIFGTLIIILAMIEPVSASQGPWHEPCGTQLPDIYMKHRHKYKASWENQLQRSLTRVQRQLAIAMAYLKQEDVVRLYEEIDIPYHQLSSIWLPGQGDVNVLLKDHKKYKQVNLKQFHTALQKFAIAFEELINDETDIRRKKAFIKTNDNCILLLCETEAALVASEISIPKRLSRSTMNLEERSPADETRRLLRDWAVFVRYQNYLHGWSTYLRRHKKLNSKKCNDLSKSHKCHLRKKSP